MYFLDKLLQTLEIKLSGVPVAPVQYVAMVQEHITNRNRFTTYPGTINVAAWQVMVAAIAEESNSRRVSGLAVYSPGSADVVVTIGFNNNGTYFIVAEFLLKQGWWAIYDDTGRWTIYDVTGAVICCSGSGGGAALILPDTEIAYGTGTGVGSSPLWTFNVVTGLLQLLDGSSNALLLIQTDDGSGNSRFTLASNNVASTGGYAAIASSANGDLGIISGAGGFEVVGIRFAVADAGSVPHGMHVHIDGFLNALFESDALSLRRVSDSGVYGLRFYENRTNGARYFEFISPDDAVTTRQFILPDNDPNPGDVLTVDSYSAGVGILKWTAPAVPPPDWTAILGYNGANTQLLMNIAGTIQWVDQ